MRLPLLDSTYHISALSYSLVLLQTIQVCHCMLALCIPPLVRLWMIQLVSVHFSCASFSGVNTKSTYTDARKVRLIHTPCKWSGWLWMSLTWNSGTIFLVFLEFSAKVPGVHTSIVWSTWRPPLLCSGKIGCYTVLVRCLVRVRHSISRMDVHTHPTLVFSHFQSPALNASYILSKAAINLSSQKLSHAAFIAIASLSNPKDLSIQNTQACNMHFKIS